MIKTENISDNVLRITAPEKLKADAPPDCATGRFDHQSTWENQIAD